MLHNADTLTWGQKAGKRIRWQNLNAVAAAVVESSAVTTTTGVVGERERREEGESMAHVLV